jgi:hypothetical protein
MSRQADFIAMTSDSANDLIEGLAHRDWESLKKSVAKLGNLAEHQIRSAS